MTIDVHTHVLPERWPDLVERWGDGRWPRLERLDACSARILVAGRHFRDITDQCWDPRRRLEDMARTGVDRQVLSTVPVMFSYWAPARAALELCRCLNDHIAGVVRDAPDPFLGLATVPLQDVELAIAEMGRAVGELGLSGVEIGSNVGGWNLDDPALFPFFEAAAARRVPLFVHPWEVLGAERLGRYFFPWLVGMPAETALAIASLILGGVLERLPDLRVCFAHGGGAFFYILPRLDAGWRVRPECQAAIPRPPSDYARRFWVDSLTHDPDVLRFLIGRIGTERVLLGSDYPFALGEAMPGETIRRLDGISEPNRARLLGGNCAAFLGLG